LAPIALGAALLAPSLARAQACCSGSSALTPARLAPHEDALVGVGVRATDIYGSFNPSGHYVGSPRGVSEFDFEEDVAGSIRVFPRAQVSALVPIVETSRRSQGASEFGGGIGDVGLTARYDFSLAGQSLTLPGIAVVASATFPTGRPVEKASTPFAVDATGTGAFEGAFALALEQTYGHVFVNLTGQAGFFAARSANGLRAHQGPQFVAFGAVGVTSDAGAAVAFTTTYTAYLSSSLDGQTTANSSRSFTRLAFTGAYPLSDSLRLQGSLFGDPPIPHFGHNEPLGMGVFLFLAKTWS
jgi:hypothetical protein